MIAILANERKALEKAGLIKHRRGGLSPQDPNFVVVNKEHCARNKKTYVVEEFETLVFLEKYDHPVVKDKVQKIRRDQLKTLKQMGLVQDYQVQNSGTYIPNATVFIDSTGQIRCKKISQYMFALNIWKKNGSKKAKANVEVD